MTRGNYHFEPMSDDRLGSDTGLPFPIEFVIRDTPRSHQSRNSKGKDRWKRKVGEIARTHVMTKAHPAVPGRSICSMRVPCAGDQRRAGGDIGWLGRDR